MSDRYQSVANSTLGKAVGKRLGLPIPPKLRRHEPGMPVTSGPVLVGGFHEGRLRRFAIEALRSIGAQVVEEPEGAVPERNGAGGFAAIVFDASLIEFNVHLRKVYDFLAPAIGQLEPNGRVIVLGTAPEEAPDATASAAQRAIEGMVRSIGKEIGGRGSTAQFVQVSLGGEPAIESTLRFLLSPRSAFVSGQVINIGAILDGPIESPADWEAPLAGTIAAVTGAARGIGRAIAEVMARDGAEVLCVDVPAQGAALSEVANRVGGTALQLDITEENAHERFADHVAERHGRLDALVHNAGITRDKTLARMTPEQWDSVLAVNLIAPQRITDEFLDRELIGEGGRIVCVSSVSGIAGNRGQANYAASKAGLIGLVRALATVVLGEGATANAVAPGFIETEMTAAMPVTIREAGRRMNSLAQGGQPVDVAETVSWLASPASAAVNGNVIRVCGQSLIGA